MSGGGVEWKWIRELIGFLYLQQIETQWNRNESSDADNTRFSGEFDSKDQQYVVVE